MNTAMPAAQRGLSFFGFIFGAFIVVLVSITGLKLIPAYMQSMKIANLFNVISADPEMQGASARDIKMSFDKRAAIEDISAITAEDIEINKVNGRLVLSASYAVKVPLAGNASLYLEFTPSSVE